MYIKIILKIPIEDQRPIFIRFLKNSRQILFEMIEEGDIISINSLFDTLVILVLNSTNTKQTKELIGTFENLLNQNVFTNSIHYTLTFILFVLLNEKEKLKIFYENKLFEKLDHDFLVLFLLDRKLYEEIPLIYSKTNDRHILAIKYCFKYNKSNLINLIKKNLKDSSDIIECWLETLYLYKESGNLISSQEWEELIKAAAVSRKSALPLDDIFSYLPKDLILDDLQLTISKAVDSSSKSIQLSEKTRLEIQDRMNKLRIELNDYLLKPINVDPLNTICCICNQQSCDNSFAIFPCGHSVHMNCFISNMDRYIDSATSLSIFNFIANLKDDYGKIADVITKSCPSCGLASLVVLDQPFITYEDNFDNKKWDIPF